MSKFIVLIFSLIVGNIALAYTLNSKLVVLDVRTPAEYSESHLKNSTNIDFYESNFKEQILKLDKTKTYKLYCHSGGRAEDALNLMKSLGFKNVENLGGLQQAAKALNRKCDGPKGC